MKQILLEHSTITAKIIQRELPWGGRVHISEEALNSCFQNDPAVMATLTQCEPKVSFTRDFSLSVKSIYAYCILTPHQCGSEDIMITYRNVLPIEHVECSTSL